MKVSARLPPHPDLLPPGEKGLHNLAFSRRGRRDFTNLTFFRQGRRDFTNTLSVGGYGVEDGPDGLGRPELACSQGARLVVG